MWLYLWHSYIEIHLYSFLPPGFMKHIMSVEGINWRLRFDNKRWYIVNHIQDENRAVNIRNISTTKMTLNSKWCHNYRVVLLNNYTPLVNYSATQYWWLYLNCAFSIFKLFFTLMYITKGRKIKNSYLYEKRESWKMKINNFCVHKMLKKIKMKCQKWFVNLPFL